MEDFDIADIHMAEPHLVGAYYTCSCFVLRGERGKKTRSRKRTTACFVVFSTFCRQDV